MMLLKEKYIDFWERVSTTINNALKTREVANISMSSKIVSQTGNTNLTINIELMPPIDSIVHVGDHVIHHEHGEGTVVWINENPQAKLPIKIHFQQKKFYLLVGMDLKEYPNLEHHRFSSIMNYKQP